MALTRRTLLVDGLRVSALLPLAPELALAARAGEPDGERVLVVLQLTGGNDGLNTVVPHRQDAYYRARPYLGLARGSLHPLDDDHGLHPAMAGLGELYGEGRLAVVQGVGSPEPDRSHFRSLEMWHTGDPFGPAGRVGWLGRLADQVFRRSPGTLPALAIEQGGLPLSMRARDLSTPTVRDPEGFRTHPASEAVAAARATLIAEEAPGDLGYLRATARSTYDTARRMAAITAQETAVEYPGHVLARQLRLVAQLVRGAFGTRIFHVSLGGFDTHSRQAPVHQDRLQQVSSALTAFQRGLEADGLDGRVVTFVFSEFGRRAAENASKGTDHGHGGPVFLVGGRVRGGLHGTPPDLERLVEGDVPSTTDYRALYTMLERDWMGLEPSTDVQALELLG